MSKTIKLVPLQSSTFEPNANIMSDYYNGVILPNSSFLVTPAFVIIYLNTRHTHTACSSRVLPCKRKLDEEVRRHENTHRNGSCRVDLHCPRIFITIENMIGWDLSLVVVHVWHDKCPVWQACLRAIHFRFHNPSRGELHKFVCQSKLCLDCEHDFAFSWQMQQKTITCSLSMLK